MAKRKPLFFGIHATPPKKLHLALAILPFVLVIGVYLLVSDVRTRANPQEKLTPGVTKMVKAVDKYAFSEDQRTGKILLWSDTYASLKRILIGISLSAICGLLVGLNMGILPGIGSLTNAFIVFVSNIPPLAMLPMLFIALGVGEISKVALIFIGTFPLIARDIFLATRQIPQEMIVKALTLGASQFGVVYRVVLPQILPRLINTIRLSMGAAWLFLIAAEAIAAKEGLGYRIFLVRRYLSMDVIIPYVLWITLLAYCVDLTLKLFAAKLYPWYQPSKDK